MANKLFSLFSKPSPVSAVRKLSAEMMEFLKQYPLAVLLVDATGRVSFANASAAQLLHTTEQDLQSSYVDRFGLTMDKIRSMAQAENRKKIIIELINQQAESVFVGAAASFLAETPFILLTLESIPYFTQLTSDNAFLHDALDVSPSAIVVQDLAGHCLFWNKRAEDLFGYQAVDIAGQDIYPFFPKEITASLQQLDQELIEKKTAPKPTDLVYKDEQGQTVALCVRKEFLPAKPGQELRILTQFEDITARHHEQQGLLQNRTLLRAVLDNVPLGLYKRDIDGNMTFFNRQSLKTLNEKDEKSVNRAHTYQTLEQVKANRLREQEILREGEVKDFPEEEYVDSQGNKRILHLRKVPLMDAGPKPLVLSIVEDITENIHRSQEVKRANNLLTAVVQNIPLGLYARFPNGTILMANKQCAEIFDSEVHMPLQDDNVITPLINETPEQVKQYAQREQDIIDSGKTMDIPEELYVTSKGETKILRLIKVPVYGEEEKDAFVLTLVEDVSQRKKQEKDLLETKNFLQTVLDNVPVAIYARGTNNTLRLMNRRAHELFPGEDEKDQESDRNEFYENREQSIFDNKKIVEILEEEYTTTEGKKLKLHLIKAPVFDKEGKPFIILTVAEDITQQKAQEAQIINARNFLQTIINNLPVSLSVKGYDGKYILWNKKSEELFGVSADKVIGKEAYRSDLNKEQLEFVREGDLRVFENKKEQDIAQELISTPKDGVKIMHTVKTPVFNEDGTPSSLIVVSEDITAKTHMEKQIREASDKNTLFVENAREGVFWAEEKKVMYSNHAFAHLLGFENAQDIVGKPLVSFVAPDYQDLLNEKYDAVLSGAEDAQEPVDICFKRTDGTLAETEFSAIASRYLGRRIVLCFVRDVTQFNRLRRDLTRQRENYRNAFEKAAVPAFILRSNGYIRSMNDACRNLLGMKEIDKTFYQNVYVRPGLKLDVRRKLREGEEAQMDYVFDFKRAADKFPGRFDSTRPSLNLHMHFNPIQKRIGLAGEVVADYVVTFNAPNFSEGNSFKQLLRRPLPPTALRPAPNSAREMLVLPNSEPYVLCSSDFKMRSCNKLFCELCQLEEDELLGQEIWHIMDEESKSVFQKDLHTLANEGTLSNRDYFINPASGLEKIAVRLTGVKADSGRYLFVLQNRTGHLQLIKVLEERSAQLNALLESTNGIVFSILLHQGTWGEIDTVSQHLAQLLGFTQDELSHKQFKDLFANSPKTPFAPVLHKAQKDLAASGKAVFTHPMKRKDGSRFEAQVTLTALDLPGQEAALVVLRDLSGERDQWSSTSKEAQELKSVRAALPGLYLKTDSNGKALEVYSNLHYLPAKEAVDTFIGKTPKAYWGEEAAQQTLLSIKESLSMNMATQFSLTWKMPQGTRYFEVSVTPITGREETVLWLKDVSQDHDYEQQVRDLYRITSEPGLSMTQQVEQILAFGLKSFRADVGLVLRFDQKGQSRVMYVTDNDLELERDMSFALEECLLDTKDGRVLLWPDLSSVSCKNCLHKKRRLGSLVAAPLYTQGKVTGALCFASKTARRGFEPGAEELMGLLARLLSLRIELRQAGKLLSEASRSFAHTLEYVDKPTALLDLDYQMSFVSPQLLDLTGRHIGNMLGRNFFEEIIRNPDLSKQAFKEAARQASGNTFTITLEVLDQKGVYKELPFEVVLCKDDSGAVVSYGLIAA